MTIASEISRLQTDKEAMRQAIIDKWVDVASNVSLDDYAACISAIEQWGWEPPYTVWVVMVWWGWWWSYDNGGWWWSINSSDTVWINVETCVIVWQWWTCDQNWCDTYFWWLIAYWWLAWCNWWKTRWPWYYVYNEWQNWWSSIISWGCPVNSNTWWNWASWPYIIIWPSENTLQVWWGWGWGWWRSYAWWGGAWGWGWGASSVGWWWNGTDWLWWWAGWGKSYRSQPPWCHWWSWRVDIWYLDDGSCWFTSATGWDCCYYCCWYCIHTFLSNWTFTIIG